jgi:hypothetical protein
MTRTVRTRAILGSLIAVLTDCGGHTAEYGAIEGSPTVPDAAGDPATGMADASGSDGLVSGSKTEGVPGRTNSGGTNGGASGATGSGGATNGNGGAPSGSGGSANDDGGLAPRATLSTPVPQVWVGALESYVTFGYPDAPPLAHEHAVLVLNPEGTEDVGSMVLGDAPPPPPPTDPNAYYPPNKGGGRLVTGDLWSRLVEGVPYSLRDVRRTDTRLIFHLNPGELWKDWCKLRTTCSIDSQDSSEHASEVDDLCADNPVGVAVCRCDDSICQWNTANPEVWTIDVELRNGILEGQVAQYEMAAGGAWTLGIRLKRVE